jgi:SpoIID/LytB domain protein
MNHERTAVRRILASLGTLLLVPGLLALPVMSPLGSSARPIAPVVVALPVSGVSAVGLSESPAPGVEADEDEAEDETDHGHDDHAVELLPAVATERTSTRPFSLVAVTWKGQVEAGSRFQVRIRERGTWSEWLDLPVEPDHGPDANSQEYADSMLSGATEPLLTPRADGVQVRVDTPSGVAPAQTSIALIDPQTSSADSSMQAIPVSSASAAAVRPSIITRAQWGADESLRGGSPKYSPTIRAGFVHHTVQSSTYSEAGAAALVRAVYAFHTVTRGYSDIGYNFLVDRFGRIYEGRAGGVDRPVVGAHTAGFNENSTAAAVIGDFSTYDPDEVTNTTIVNAVGTILGWKLGLHHVDPMAPTSLVSGGMYGTNTKYPAGQTVPLPHGIMGHGDLNATACPGKYLKSELNLIRATARQAQKAMFYSPKVSASTLTYGGTGTTFSATTSTPGTWRLAVFSVCSTTALRTITLNSASSGAISLTWNGRDGSSEPALPGTYRLVASGTSSTGDPAVAWTTLVTVLPTSGSPAGPCAEAVRSSAADRWTTSVVTGREVAPESKMIVVANGEDAHVTTALVAAPYAARVDAPLLLTAASGVSTAVLNDVTARKATTAVLIGTSTALPSGIESQLRSAGVTRVVRLTGASVEEVAAAVAADGWTEASMAFIAPRTGEASAVAAAAAVATKMGVPLLLTNTSALSVATIDALALLTMPTPVFVGRTITDSAMRTLAGARRIAGVDDAATSIAIAKEFEGNGLGTISLVALDTAGLGDLPSAARRGQIILASAGSAVTPAVKTFLRATPRIGTVKVMASKTVMSDAVVGDVAQTVRLAASETTTITPEPTVSAIEVPSAFSFTGSGFGHGVGLPQYGAANMARDGRTVAEITGYYYTGSSLAAVRDDMDVHVNLLAGVNTVQMRSRAVDATPMTPSDDPASPVEVTVGQTVILGDPGDTWLVRPRNGTLEVVRTVAGVQTVVATGSPVTMRWAGTRNPGTAGEVPAYLDVTGPSESFGSTARRYRYGHVVVTPSNTNGVATMNVVNVVRLKDEYLYGIAESPSSWPIEALKAQAIASRSYALAAIRSGIRVGIAAHVYDTTLDQVFAGWVKEVSAFGAQWKAAVDSTSVDAETGQVIVSGSSLVKAYFYSSSGGRTQNSEEVWSANLPWLRSVDDPWSLRSDNPNRSWTTSVSQVALATAFALPDVQSLNVRTRTSGGGVRLIDATSSAGTVATLSGEVMRSRLGLKSTWVSAIVASGSVISPTPSPTSPATPSSPTPTPTPSPTPTPTPTTSAPTASVTVTAPATATLNVPFVLSGTVVNAGAGSTVQRYLQVDTTWAGRGLPVTVNPDGTWRMVVTADSVRDLTYRMLLRDAAGKSLATSNVVTISVQNPQPAITLTASETVPVGSAFTLAGQATAFPPGSVVQRQILNGTSWVDRGNTVTIGSANTWSMRATAPSTAQTMTFRVRLLKDGKLIATSNQRVISFTTASAGTTKTTAITISAPTSVTVGTAFTLKGTVVAAPAGAVVQRQVRSGTSWVNRGNPVATSNEAWSMRITAPSGAQTLTFRTLLLKDGKVVATSVGKAIAFTTATASRSTAVTIAAITPATVKVSTAFSIKGTVVNAPAGATVQRKVLVGTSWVDRGSPVRIGAGGAWSMSVTAPGTAQKMSFRFSVLNGSNTVANSVAKEISFVR